MENVPVMTAWLATEAARVASTIIGQYTEFGREAQKVVLTSCQQGGAEFVG
jgi:hypothetical protein